MPLVLFSYLNPIVAAGPSALARAAAAGIHGLLVTDLPVGGDAEVEREIGESPLAFIRLVAPTTPTPRMAEIARHGSGFVYLISRLGVTGMQSEIASGLAADDRAFAQRDEAAGVRRLRHLRARAGGASVAAARGWRGVGERRGARGGDECARRRRLIAARALDADTG